MTIGESLKRFRKGTELTQDDIAKVLKVTRQAYHSYETDKANPPSQKIIELANFYNISTDYLLGLTDDPRPVNQILKEFQNREKSDEFNSNTELQEIKTRLKMLENAYLSKY